MLIKLSVYKILTKKGTRQVVLVTGKLVSDYRNCNKTGSP